MPGIKERFAAAVRELGSVADRLDEREIDAFMDAIIRARRVFLVGAGREGLATRAFAMRLTHLGKQAHWLWDDTTPSLGAGDLLIAVSGSGEIGHIDYIHNEALARGAAAAVVTGDPSGRTPQKAKHVLRLPAAVFKGRAEVVASGQPMGNLFEQALFVLFDQIVIELAERMGIDRETMVARHRNVE